MVFNRMAGLQVFLAAVPSAVTYAVLHYGLGWESAPWWAALAALVCIVPVDALTRLANIADGEDEDGDPVEGDGVGALVYPASGGHLMFIPMYAIASLMTVGLLAGVINP